MNIDDRLKVKSYDYSSETIDQEEIVCPYCTIPIINSNLVKFDKESMIDDSYLTCSNCEAEFIVSRTMSITYSTFKKSEDQN